MPSDRNPNEWKPVFKRPPPASPMEMDDSYTLFIPEMCATMWAVDRVRFEIDTCHRRGWYEVDAVQAQGGVSDLGNILNVTDKLYISAAPGFTGEFTFGLTATTCFPSFATTSPPSTVNVRVLEPPFTVSATREVAKWSRVDVYGAYPGPVTDNVMVLELPTGGDLQYILPNGTREGVDAVLRELGPPGGSFQYRTNSYCRDSEPDSFIVQLAADVVMEVPSVVLARQA